MKRSAYWAGALNLFINCQDISAALEQEIWPIQVCSQLKEKYDDVQLTAIKVIEKLTQSSMEPQRPEIGDVFAGRLKVVVAGIKDGRSIHSHITFAVSASQDAWVAKKTMYKNRAIEESDFVLKKINVAPFVGLKSMLVGELPSGVLNRTIKKNEILFLEYLDAENIINPRQLIDLVITSGNLMIKTKGIALGSAKKAGDQIKVQVLETGATVSGLVKGKEYIYVEI